MKNNKQVIATLTNALFVIALTPNIVAFLKANDPMALKQVREALALAHKT